MTSAPEGGDIERARDMLGCPLREVRGESSSLAVWFPAQAETPLSTGK